MDSSRPTISIPCVVSTSSGEVQKALRSFPPGNFGFYFKSTEDASQQLLEALQDDTCHVIGLYGSRGTGKTALVRAEKKKYEKNMFDRVLFPTVSKNQDIYNIQDGIANKLDDLHFQSDDSELVRVMKIISGFVDMEGTTLVILDDFPTMYQPLEVGIPYRSKRYKVLLTTREKSDCIAMGCDRCIHLKPLHEDDAWVLLQKLSSVSTENDLSNVAQEVAYKCNGLPALIKDVMSSLVRKSITQWEESLVSLSHSTARYQIFISFRGPDTRVEFTEHLYQALCSKGFKTFMDDKSMEGGSEIEKLFDDIEESRCAIIIFSKNYAHSEWCLKELVKILECKDHKEKSQLVLPVFYDVAPKDVRYVLNSYADAMIKHEKHGKDSETVETWKNALFYVCKLIGFEKLDNCSRDEFIQKIVNSAYDQRHRLHIHSMYMDSSQTSEVESTPSQVEPEPLIPNPVAESLGDDTWDMESISSGIDVIFQGLESSSGAFMYLGSTIQAQNGLLKALQDDRCHSIGLFGRRGCGKTALVKAEMPKYEKIFDTLVFVTVSAERLVIGNLQNQIANQLNLEFQAVRSQYRRASAIESTLLKNKDKVLVIFDGVSTNFGPQNIEDIGIPNPSPSNQCKILLITHDMKYCNMITCHPWIPLRPLSDEDAWKLLQQYSGIDHDSPRDLFDVAREVSFQCKGLPRVIEDVVSSLHNMNTEHWRETLDCLKHSTASHQIFISFRGKDTRDNFTASLFDTLVQGGFRVFKDDEQLRSGDQVSETLMEAIEQSRASIVVLSENFAQSSWCLDELVKILKCREEVKQLVLPIFYKVDPSHVRYLIGSFGEAMAKKKERFGEDKIQEWTSALFKVASLSGMDYRTGSQIGFIKEIVQYVQDNKHRLHIL